jgi:hypothetical protein
MGMGMGMGMGMQPAYSMVHAASALSTILIGFL